MPSEFVLLQFMVIVSKVENLNESQNRIQIRGDMIGKCWL